jgi:hypothetical protein
MLNIAQGLACQLCRATEHKHHQAEFMVTENVTIRCYCEACVARVAAITKGGP